MPSVLRSLIRQSDTGSLKSGVIQVNKKATTTDATATDILVLPVALNTVVGIRCFGAAYKSDYSAGWSGAITCGARRGASGNVASLGTASVVTVEDSASTPALSIAVDTSAQTAKVQVTGVAAETWKWEVYCEYIYV